jgi:hypothetical protein
VAAIAPLLANDEMDVSFRLDTINLSTVTRTPSEARAKKLADLRRRRRWPRLGTLAGAQR